MPANSKSEEDALQKAVTALVKALGEPEENVAGIEITERGYVRVRTRDRALRTLTVERFKRKENP